MYFNDLFKSLTPFILNAGQKYCRMLLREHSATLLTFIKLPFVIKTFVLSIFEWMFYAGFTVHINYEDQCQLLRQKLTLNAPISTSRLLFSSAEMFKKPLWQTVWTQIRLLLKEQSVLGPHCLLLYLIRQ